jgi:predicted glutamine amidotransferase
MCRFLMIRSDAPLHPGRFLAGFAELAERSPAPDGDPQADGWGVSWLDDEGRWQARRFLEPVWESSRVFPEIPASFLFCFHARSASAPDLKNNIDFNQPFVDGRFSFVFNGFLQGMSLPQPVPGRIGSQKIWALLREFLDKSGPVESLAKLRDLLNSSARRVQALNIGLADGTNLYGLCQYDDHEDYYRVWHHASPGLRMIGSGPLEGFRFEPAPLDSIFVL